MQKNNRYKKLLTNTLVLGIGTFGSKVMTILLMPLYTNYLTNGEYGIVDLLDTETHPLAQRDSRGL